jgi:hypothetical protein
MLSLDELSAHTGLTTVFIRKCLTRLKSILEPHISHGEFNRIYADSSGVVIFDQIAQLKKEGLSLPEIERRLAKQLEQVDQTDSSNPVQTPVKEAQTSPDLLSEVLKINGLLVEEKNERIKTLQDLNSMTQRFHELDQVVKKLPPGRLPEDMIEELAEKSAALDSLKRQGEDAKRVVAQVTQELKEIGPFRFKRRKELIRKLEQLTNDEPA